MFCLTAEIAEDAEDKGFDFQVAADLYSGLWYPSLLLRSKDFAVDGGDNEVLQSVSIGGFIGHDLIDDASVTD